MRAWLLACVLAAVAAEARSKKPKGEKGIARELEKSCYQVKAFQACVALGGSSSGGLVVVEAPER